MEFGQEILEIDLDSFLSETSVDLAGKSRLPSGEKVPQNKSDKSIVRRASLKRTRPFATESSSRSTVSDASKTLFGVSSPLLSEIGQEFSYSEEEGRTISDEKIATHIAICFEEVDVTESSETLIYPALTDPGINAAYNYSAPSIPVDGVGDEFYKSKCKEFNVVPIRRVLESLRGETLNLQFYYPTELELRAILETLCLNKHVKFLNLPGTTFNEKNAQFLNDLLTTNKTIRRLNLSKCLMGPELLEILVPGLKYSRFVRELDLSWNNLRREGLEHVANIMSENISIVILNLSHNGFDWDCLNALKIIFDENITLEDLDISWNFFSGDFGPVMKSLKETSEVKKLNMSWNGLSSENFCTALSKGLRKNDHLQSLDLSHNLICGRDNIKTIAAALMKCPALNDLNLSYNLLSSEDALCLIKSLLNNGNCFDSLDLTNVWLHRNCDSILRKVRKKLNKTLIFSGILHDWMIKGPSVNELLLRRAQYLGMKSKHKRRRKNFVHFLLRLNEEEMASKQFLEKMQVKKIKLDGDLIVALLRTYACPSNLGTVNVAEMCQEISKLFPEDVKTLPEPKIKKKKKKGRKHRGKKKSAKGSKEGSKKATSKAPKKKLKKAPAESSREMAGTKEVESPRRDSKGNEVGTEGVHKMDPNGTGEGVMESSRDVPESKEVESSRRYSKRNEIGPSSKEGSKKSLSEAPRKKLKIAPAESSEEGTETEEVESPRRDSKGTVGTEIVYKIEPSEMEESEMESSRDVPEYNEMESSRRYSKRNETGPGPKEGSRKSFSEAPKKELKNALTESSGEVAKTEEVELPRRNSKVNEVVLKVGPNGEEEADMESSREVRQSKEMGSSRWYSKSIDPSWKEGPKRSFIEAQKKELKKAPTETSGEVAETTEVESPRKDSKGNEVSHAVVLKVGPNEKEVSDMESSRI